MTSEALSPNIVSIKKEYHIQLDQQYINLGIIFGHFHQKLAMKNIDERKAPAMPKLTHLNLAM